MDYAVLNRMLEARVKDLAARKPARGQAAHEERVRTQRDQLAKSLGLFPSPAKTDLKAEVTGVILRDGYRIEKVRFESRPGVLVTAHLYLPAADGKHPLVLAPHGHFEFKKSTPVVQAKGIGLALLGFACIIVDSPGHSWDNNEFNERKGMGTHDDPWLSMGAPVQGHYVWDLVRALDYCETRSEIDAGKVGITGASGGGTATLLAFAFDERIQVAVPVCAATSMEIMPNNGCFCNHLPAIMNVGDRADILAMRAPAPVCLIGASDDPEFPQDGHRRTLEKMQSIYRNYKAESSVRLEIVEGGHDYNRRMRETMYAFMAQHLKGERPRQHLAEPRPLTDGQLNPYEAGTEKHSSPELLVVREDQRQTLTFRQILERNLDEPYPATFDAAKRVAPWLKYGHLEFKIAAPDLILADPGTMPASAHTIELAPAELNIRMLIYLGLSPAEFVAQVLHLHLPGKPDGWEADAVGNADALSSMIASVKTLVNSREQQDAIKNIRAVGKFSSMVAKHLKLLRPALEVQTDYEAMNWRSLYNANDPVLIQPGARYLKWPFES